MVVFDATLPTVGYLGLLLCIARCSRVRLRPQVVAFALVWGAGVAAPGAGLVNDLLQRYSEAAEWLLTVTGVPAVEEAAKATILLVVIAVWPTEVRGVRAGIVAGALVGFGFGFAENVGYFLLAGVQEGRAGLVRAIAVRGFLEGAVHPVFSASTGAGLGVKRATATNRGRLRPALVGFGAAVAQHAVWNGLASPAVSGILCNGVGPSGACRGSADPYRLFVAVPLVVAAALAPGVMTLAALAWLARSPDGESGFTNDAGWPSCRR
jgi:RsiW-degrading membrane proteinase PrsW (M82 family)